jgi:predicted nuclease with TOPRIM domain
MEFIKESEQRANEREQQLVAEKKLLEEKVEKLSLEMKMQKAQNDELIKKLRIMEFSMRQYKKKGAEEAPKQVKKIVRH